jgi:DNA-binding transcriptional ArsR family regulator
VKSFAKQAVELDRMIHERARLALMALLYGAEEADFLFLLRESGLTKGNMQSHLARLEEGGYVAIEKSFIGKIPHTVCRLTPAGRQAFKRYRKGLKKLAGQLG